MLRLLLCLTAFLTYKPLIADYKDNDYINRPITDDIFYFVMVDRFFDGDTKNNTGEFKASDDELFKSASVLKHGYWPENKGYYLGGDFKGLTEKLDYLKSMGITALWLSPVQKNNPVQGGGQLENSSAGYHGYWVTDFTSVDPHFGDETSFKALIDSAHSKGMKVFIDVIANHTADIIRFKECNDCPYRSVEDYPYSQSTKKRKINPNFKPDKDPTKAFAHLTDPSYAYTPVISENYKNLKKPEWLNNPIYYHNRGNSTFAGENSLLGDFYGLDDLFTEHPRVVEGMIDIYKDWISRYKIDGFRLDTVKHVNIEFWQSFVPEIMDHARKEGLPQFFMFGEVFSGDPKVLAYYTRNTKMPSVLDFALHGAITNAVTGLETQKAFEQVIEQDDIYRLGSSPNQLMTFASNHDIGRIGHAILKAKPNATDDELLNRAILAQSLLFFTRGVPIIYYGDEQGFTGDGGDKDAREPMFASKVKDYNDNKLIGTDKSTADVNFDPSHPLYKAISEFSTIYKAHPSLRSGEQKLWTKSSASDGLYAFTRQLASENERYLVAYNFSEKTIPFHWDSVSEPKAIYPSQLKLKADASFEIPALSFVIVSGKPAAKRLAKPSIEFTYPKPNSLVSDTFYVEAEVLGLPEAVVEFSYRKAESKTIAPLHSDPTSPYRTYMDGSAFEQGQALEVFAKTTDHRSGQVYKTALTVVIDGRQPEITIDYQNGNKHSHAFFMSDDGRVGILTPLHDKPFSFLWPTNSKTVTVVYGSITPGNSKFTFDRPIELNFTDHIASRLVSKKSALKAQLSVSNQGEIKDKAKWQMSTKPKLLNTWTSDSKPFNTDLFVRGGMNTWEATTPMSYLGQGHYQTKLNLAGGRHEFKVADSQWSAPTNFGSPIGSKGLTASGQSGNLSVVIPKEKSGFYELNFFQLNHDQTNKKQKSLSFITIKSMDPKTENSAN